jgi:hypothetical protein
MQLGLSYKKADAEIRGKFSLDTQAKATFTYTSRS